MPNVSNSYLRSVDWNSLMKFIYRWRQIANPNHGFCVKELESTHQFSSMKWCTLYSFIADKWPKTPENQNNKTRMTPMNACDYQSNFKMANSLFFKVFLCRCSYFPLSKWANIWRFVEEKNTTKLIEEELNVNNDDAAHSSFQPKSRLNRWCWWVRSKNLENFKNIRFGSVQKSSEPDERAPLICHMCIIVIVDVATLLLNKYSISMHLISQ